MKKIGIITFHHSHNCGSMMQAVALQTVIDKLGYDVEIIDFSNVGQRKLYGVWFPINSIKNIVKNILIFPHKDTISKNRNSYESFMKKHMHLSSRSYKTTTELDDSSYSVVVAGSDQIWNITIVDGDDAYFLPWVKNARKVAYAPSFGARNIKEYASDCNKYISFLNEFDSLSIREKNGNVWIKKLIDKDVPVVLDPTLLLREEDYLPMLDNSYELPQQYIFYYSPHYNVDINRLVKKISQKYNLPVIAFNAKAFYVKRMDRMGFELPKYENPSIYLSLIRNAELVITTSFHGTVFSSIFRKKFWIVKNGGMNETDDRVYTMTEMLDLSDRIISVEFDDSFDYSVKKDYSNYEKLLKYHTEKSLEYLAKAIVE